MFGRKRKPITKEKEVVLFKNQPIGTESIVNIDDIGVPPVFTRRPPDKDKIKKYVAAHKKLKRLEKPITVVAEINENGKINKLFLVDGYVQYLIALYNGYEKVPVKYQH